MHLRLNTTDHFSLLHLSVSKQQLYWLLQAFGWLSFSLVNFLMVSVIFGVIPMVAVSSLLTGLFGLGLSHLIRGLIHREGWFSERLPVLLRKTALAALAGGTLLQAFSFFTGIYLFQFFDFSTAIPSVTAFMLFDYIVVFTIWLLLYAGFQLYQNTQTAENERWRLAASVNAAELKALKNQVNPHFIFNCLNSIRALIFLDQDKASEIVTRLSNILRYTLVSNNDQTVSLDTEIATVEDYLALESVRLESRLRYTINIDPRTMALPVPPMVLQTIVENGIKHGIAPSRNGGLMSIEATLRNNALVIDVRNPGRITPRPDSTGTGLKNATDRIQLLFGHHARLTLTQTNSDEVHTRILLPMETSQLEATGRSTDARVVSPSAATHRQSDQGENTATAGGANAPSKASI